VVVKHKQIIQMSTVDDEQQNTNKFSTI